VEVRTFVGVVATALQPSGWAPWGEILLAGALFAALGLAGVLGWSRSLRAQLRRRTRDLEIAERDTIVRARQQAAVAALGQRALAGIALELLLEEARGTASPRLSWRARRHSTSCCSI
jgi:hypothetical protein